MDRCVAGDSESWASGPFHRAEAVKAGVTEDRLRGPSFIRVRRNCYAPISATRDREFDIVSSLVVMPDGAALYGVTAAEWYGLPVDVHDDIHVVVPGSRTVPRRRPGIVTHQGLGPAESMTVRGLAVTTPERTWLDLSLTLSRTELVVVGDAMVRAGLSAPQRLIDAADQARGRRLIVNARADARRIRGGVDSAQETRLRLILVDGGVGEPAVNPDLADEAGGWIGRPDLAYVAERIAIQYEGDVHRVNRRRFRADIARDDVLIDHGWEVIRVTAEDLRQPWRLCERVRRARHRQRLRAVRP